MFKWLGYLESIYRYWVTSHFELYKTIGKAACISSNSLLPVDPDFTLKDYSRRIIPIGATVNLVIGWKDTSVTVPVYLAEKYGEPFLLGTNAILGLMTPDPGVEGTGMENADCSRPKSCGVRLVSSTRVPSRCSVVVTVQVTLMRMCQFSAGLVKWTTAGWLLLQLDESTYWSTTPLTHHRNWSQTSCWGMLRNMQQQNSCEGICKFQQKWRTRNSRSATWQSEEQ